MPVFQVQVAYTPLVELSNILLGMLTSGGGAEAAMYQVMRTFRWPITSRHASTCLHLH